jgi:hypothetical protein
LKPIDVTVYSVMPGLHFAEWGSPAVMRGPAPLEGT